MTVLCGLDVSSTRIGWALVDVDTGAPLSCGTESLDVAGGGWQEHQARRAIGYIATHAANHHAAEVAVWVREEPISRFPRAAKIHGAACQASDAACRAQWPWAPFWTLMPTEWRKRVGLPGNASKAAVSSWAIDQLWAANWMVENITPVRDDQDAADALGVALAGWDQWTNDARTEGK